MKRSGTVTSFKDEGGNLPQKRGTVPVTVLIPVKNEVRNLPRALGSVRWADEVWVVDSNSTDDSVRIAESEGAKVVQFDFSGTWPKKKNWSLETLDFANEWVFILDADEELPPEAEAEFRAIVTDPVHPVDGYWINRRFVFMKRWMRHAYYPNWNLRLFRHQRGRYEKLTEAATDSGDNEVHEHLVVEGKTGKLVVEMNHYPYPDVATFVEKHNRYSSWEAHVMVNPAPKKNRLQLKEAKYRRALRRLSLYLPFRPFLRFCYVYCFQRGFLDGREGWYFARLHAYYEFLSVAKAYELRSGERRKD